MDSAASDAITLDKSDLSALSSDVRIGILRAIDSSEGGTISAAALADEMSIGKSTLHQHLAVLETAGIICADKSRKWHMYSLTRKGKCILHPKQSLRFVLALSSSVFFGLYGVYMLVLFFKGVEFLGGGHVKHLPELLIGGEIFLIIAGCLVYAALRINNRDKSGYADSLVRKKFADEK